MVSSVTSGIGDVPSSATNELRSGSVGSTDQSADEIGVALGRLVDLSCSLQNGPDPRVFDEIQVNSVEDPAPPLPRTLDDHPHQLPFARRHRPPLRSGVWPGPRRVGAPGSRAPPPRAAADRAAGPAPRSDSDERRDQTPRTPAAPAADPARRRRAGSGGRSPRRKSSSGVG